MLLVADVSMDAAFNAVRLGEVLLPVVLRDKVARLKIAGRIQPEAGSGDGGLTHGDAIADGGEARERRGGRAGWLRAARLHARRTDNDAGISTSTDGVVTAIRGAAIAAAMLHHMLGGRGTRGGGRIINTACARARTWPAAGGTSGGGTSDGTRGGGTRGGGTSGGGISGGGSGCTCAGSGCGRTSPRATTRGDGGGGDGYTSWWR